jgi:hypothetical protein
MTKLLITEITRMKEAFCVIGLEREAATIHSIRPLPRFGIGWRHFPYRRGDILENNFLRLPAPRPHVEDRTSLQEFRKTGEVQEAEIVPYLRRAETAGCLADLFGCRIRENRRGAGDYAEPGEARRSICGCETQNLLIELYGNELRASLVLPSGEALRDLPMVDRDWNDFIDAALAEGRGANRHARLEGFLKAKFQHKVISCAHHYVRLGLTRPYKERCWVMLDTLFPLPVREWLEEF